MYDWKNYALIIISGIILVAVILGGYGLIAVAAASGIVAISAINAAPALTRKKKRRLILALTGMLIIVFLPVYSSYIGYLLFLLGGLIGIGLMILKGPEYREVALMILGGSALIGSGFTHQAGRAGSSYVLLFFGVLSIVTAWYLRKSSQ